MKQLSGIYVLGTLKGADSFQERSLGCSWSVELSPGWNLKEGELSGHTQFDSPANGNRTFVWDQLMEFHLETTTLAGWPSIALHVKATDQFSQKQTCGYSCVPIPSEPGTHLLTAPCWVPRPSTAQRLKKKYLGGSVEVPSQSQILSSDQRTGLATMSVGEVTLELTIIPHGFEERGVMLGPTDGVSTE
eukprot:gnl/Dysnectes_brevis/2351_a2774_1526.p1 GENE.gnl/Dysnectes_brevis/2351_a2774_1526~~gnl/Dysnectes_brevis/2351_a2774_1526.p1  ORF type:complete len:189 (+),score=19.68 gnl/Dysnectes_brevis/2351_a2774_1526:134-700(+)